MHPNLDKITTMKKRLLILLTFLGLMCPFQGNAVVQAHDSLSDSIRGIIQSAGQIVAIRYYAPMEGELEIVEQKNLSAKNRKVLKSVFLKSDISKSDAIPFGIFQPKVQYEFSSRKGTCTFIIDFSLRLIRLKTDHSEQQFTMQDNAILEESIHIFPDDNFMAQLLNSTML